MECNIFVCVEVKINNRWTLINYPKIERNYKLFTLMANVKNEDNKWDPMLTPKGLPKNISKGTKLYFDSFWKLGVHSISWLDNSELNDLNRAVNTWGLKIEVAKMFSWFDNKYPSRIVFWFDDGGLK
jgi:hypothetical protein